MLGVRSIASGAVAAALVVAGAPPALASPPLFSGDYATGDFSQWPTVQARGYNGPGSDYAPTYSASVERDPVKGEVARFELRPGDVPPFGGGERSEVQGDSSTTGGSEGQTRWYRFSTKFDQTFPMNHADLGWGVTNQWHDTAVGGSPPVSWTVDERSGFWSLTIEKQSAPGVWLGTFSILDVPLDVGQWHDVTMQIHWSASDDRGWIRLWLNGVRQRFVNGDDTYAVRTLIPGTSSAYYKEGLYRKATSSTDIVYHTGFRSAGSMQGL